MASAIRTLRLARRRSAGLLEALVETASRGAPTLLIAYDTEYPAPIFAFRPIPDAAGIGLVLSPTQTERSLAQIAVDLTDAPATPLADPALDSLRLAIPALRGLPLLKLLADGRAAQANLEYLAPLSLAVTLTPVPTPC